jgi:hypothetical protein
MTTWKEFVSANKQLHLSTTALTGNNNPPPPHPSALALTSSITKCPPATPRGPEKQAVDRKLKPFEPVINQTFVTNSMLCKKVITTVALPGNVLSQEQIIVE